MLESIEGEHGLLGAILVSVSLILLVYWSSTHFSQWMINWNNISFTIWILLIVINQVMFSISFQFNPSTINDIWKIICSIIFRSYPGIISLSIWMVGNLNVMNWVMSKFDLSHSFCLQRFLLIQTFNDVGSHRHLSCEYSFFGSCSLRNSFLNVIYLYTLSCVS